MWGEGSICTLYRVITSKAFREIATMAEAILSESPTRVWRTTFTHSTCLEKRASKRSREEGGGGQPETMPSILGRGKRAYSWE